MNTLKKLVTLLIALCILCSCVVAHADITAETTDKTQSTIVSLDLGGTTSYTIQIPSSVAISTSEATTTLTITLQQGFVLADIPCLRVRLTEGFTDEESATYVSLTNSGLNMSYDIPITAVDNMNREKNFNDRRLRPYQCNRS